MKLTKISILLLTLSLNFVACSNSDDSVDEKPTIENPDMKKPDNKILQKDFITELKRNSDFLPVLKLSEIENQVVDTYRIKTEIDNYNSNLKTYTFSQSSTEEDFYIGDNTIEVEALLNDKVVAKDEFVYNHRVALTDTDTFSKTIEIKKTASTFNFVITADQSSYTSLTTTLNDKTISTGKSNVLNLKKTDLVKGINTITAEFKYPDQVSAGGVQISVVATTIMTLKFTVRDSDATKIQFE